MNLRKRARPRPMINLTPLIDVVFLLLIFFMLTSTLVTVNALDILLPKAQGKTENKKSTAVSITRKLDYYVDRQKVGEGEIETFLLNTLRDSDDPTIVLRAEEGVPIEKAVRVLDIANRNKIKVVLAVRPK